MKYLQHKIDGAVYTRCEVNTNDFTPKGAKREMNRLMDQYAKWLPEGEFYWSTRPSKNWHATR